MGPTPSIATLDDVRPAGPPGDAASWREAAEGATEGLEPEADIHATADYRLHLARVLTARALASAWSASGAATGEGRAA
jgi:carbon-monoxide dehydrogenase medium subunit